MPKPVPAKILKIMEKIGAFHAAGLPMNFAPPNQAFKPQFPLRRDGTLSRRDRVGYYVAALDTISPEGLRALQQAVQEVVEGGTHHYEPPTLIMSGDE
jgi:hypothetical protein